MFKVGQQVVYPLQGAGVIEAIEEHKIRDKIYKYYAIKLAGYDMKIRFPVGLEKKVGLRKIVGKEEFEKAFEILKGKETDVFLSSKERYTTNLERMKTGSVSNIARVAKCLCERAKQKALSSSEKRLFDNACFLLAGELAYIQGVNVDEASSIVKDILRGIRINGGDEKALK